MSVLELRRDLGKAHEGKPRSEPDRGNPAVRDRRGACGIAVFNGSRTQANREIDGVATGPYLHGRAAFLSRPSHGVCAWLEEFYGFARGIFDENLLAVSTLDRLASELGTPVSKFSDSDVDVFDFEATRAVTPWLFGQNRGLRHRYGSDT